MGTDEHSQTLRSNICILNTGNRKLANNVLRELWSGTAGKKQKSLLANKAADMSVPGYIDTLPTFPGIIDMFNKAAIEIRSPRITAVTDNGTVIVLSRIGEYTSDYEKHRFYKTINVCGTGSYGVRTWHGRINLDGSITGLGLQSDTDILSLLADIQRDPAVALKAQGQRTGKCCVCGRALTKPTSIEEGIGPTCGSRFGI